MVVMYKPWTEQNYHDVVIFLTTANIYLKVVVWWEPERHYIFPSSWLQFCFVVLQEKDKLMKDNISIVLCRCKQYQHVIMMPTRYIHRRGGSSRCYASPPAESGSCGSGLWFGTSRRYVFKSLHRRRFGVWKMHEFWRVGVFRFWSWLCTRVQGY